MRLDEVERGEGLRSRLLIALISTVSGMRLPDAARVAFYHKSFFSAPLGTWTQAAMRGASRWSVGERELMAAMVAKWNGCAFCTGAHSAVAARVCERALVDATLDHYRSAPVSGQLKETLAFLERLTLDPGSLTPEHAKKVLEAGVDREAVADAIAVASVFNIICRYADALDFAEPSTKDFDRAAKMLLKRGYG